MAKLGDAVSQLRVCLEKLENAVTASDYSGALATSASVRNTLKQVDALLATAELSRAGLDLDAARAERDELASAAERLLAAAPAQGPRGELDDAVFGGDQQRTSALDAFTRRREEWLSERDELAPHSGVIHCAPDASANVADGAGQELESAAKSTGTPLSAEVRGPLEQAAGVELGDVRVHTGDASDAAAGAIGARAYTTGQDIHFRDGEYDPWSTEGYELLAHEVAHTVQQRGGSSRVQAKLEVSEEGDSEEIAADEFAETVMSGEEETAGGKIDQTPSQQVMVPRQKYQPTGIPELDAKYYREHPDAEIEQAPQDKTAPVTEEERFAEFLAWAGDVDPKEYQDGVAQGLLPGIEKFLAEIVGKDQTRDGQIPDPVVKSKDGVKFDSPSSRDPSELTVIGEKESKTGPSDSKTEADDEGWGLLWRSLGDVAIGLAGGIAAAFMDYIGFNPARDKGEVGPYRLEQVGTQSFIGMLVDHLGGDGALLAFAALQWCFTNDLLYYGFSELIGKALCEGADDGFLQPDARITWASWSLLGVLGGIGNDEHPMTYEQAMWQGLYFGPLLATVLALIAEGYDLTDVAGGVLSVSIENLPEEDVDYQGLLQTLKLQANIGDAVDVYARLSPYIVGGVREGNKVQGAIEFSDNVVKALIGWTTSVNTAGEREDGKPVADVTKHSLNLGVQYTAGDEEETLQIKGALDVPVMQKVAGIDKGQLTPTQVADLEIPEHNDALARLHVAYENGPLQLESGVLARLGSGQYKLTAGVEYQTGKVYFGGQVAYVHSIAYDGVAYRFKLTVNDPLGGIRYLIGAD